MRKNASFAPLIVCAILAALIIGSLGGCTPAPVRLACPPLVQYGPQEQTALARELRAHPDLREVPMFLMDYGNERAECRALGGKSPLTDGKGGMMASISRE